MADKRLILASISLLAACCAGLAPAAWAQVAGSQGAAAAGAPAAGAPPAPVVSQAVVQPVPGRAGLSLNAALARLAQNPRDAEALIDAGRAALSMGDVDAAIGFFRRADEVSPGNPRVKAGLAGAFVRNENPFDAIPLFAEAERAGPIDAAAAADRGLAYDLVGDNATAQRHYRLALAREANDEVLRRLAISQAIGGDKASAEKTLAPLVSRQDKPGLRTRAFAFAILGLTDDAVGIAYASLPPELAAAISPYLRYMPRLTPAQQAAAANFGHFPRASEIGRDDPRVAQYAPAGARRPAVLAAADAALIPKGEPLGRNARSRPARPAARDDASTRPAGQRTALAGSSPARSAPAELPPVRVAPPEVQPSRAIAAAPPVAAVQPAGTVQAGTAGLSAPPSPTASVMVSAAPPPLDLPAEPPKRSAVVAAAAPIAAAPVSPAPVSPAPVAPAPAAAQAVSTGELPPIAAATAPPAATPAAVLSAAVPPVSAPAALPGFASLEGSASSAAPAVSRPAAAAPVQAAPPPRNLLEAFADLATPAGDILPAAGAVDIRRITPARAAPRAEEAKPAAKPAKPPPPSHPSRIWVQVATGRDKAALGFDWRRMARGAADVFRGKSAHVSAWGQTNRLLTGPFPSEAAANQFIAQLRRADIDGAFVWTSPAGQVVDVLPAR